MSGVFGPLAGDLIDGPAFLYDNDFWMLIIFVVLAAVIITAVVLLLVKRKRRKENKSGMPCENTNKSGEE